MHDKRDQPVDQCFGDNDAVAVFKLDVQDRDVRPEIIQHAFGFGTGRCKRDIEASLNSRSMPIMSSSSSTRMIGFSMIPPFSRLASGARSVETFGPPLRCGSCEVCIENGRFVATLHGALAARVGNRDSTTSMQEPTRNMIQISMRRNGSNPAVDPALPATSFSCGQEPPLSPRIAFGQTGRLRHGTYRHAGTQKHLR